MFRAVVLDFDGVILESVSVKTRAFLALFGDSLDERERQRVKQIHLDHPGRSRFDKFRMMHEALFDCYDESLAPSLDARFSSFVQHEMEDCPLVPGVLEFLSSSGCPERTFIASAAPQTELHTIAERRGMSAMFKRIYGAPWTKPEALASIMRDEGLTPGQMVFIGDAPSDQAAALEAGVPFIGRIGPDDSAPFTPDHIMTTVSDLWELQAVWDDLVGR